MQSRQKKGKRKEQYLKLAAKYWTSTKTQIARFYD